jgi:hypothetical protein
MLCGEIKMPADIEVGAAGEKQRPFSPIDPKGKLARCAYSSRSLVACIIFPALAQVQANSATLIPNGSVRNTLSPSDPVLLTAAT